MTVEVVSQFLVRTCSPAIPGEPRGWARCRIAPPLPPPLWWSAGPHPAFYNNTSRGLSQTTPATSLRATPSTEGNKHCKVLWSINSVCSDSFWSVHRTKWSHIADEKWLMKTKKKECLCSILKSSIFEWVNMKYTTLQTSLRFTYVSSWLDWVCLLCGGEQRTESVLYSLRPWRWNITER